MTGYRISYRDPDGRTGNASVKAFLLRTDVPPTFGPGSTTFLPCDFLSNSQGTVTATFTNHTVSCSQSINDNAFHYFEIELWRRAAVGGIDKYVSFEGIDFP